MSRIDSAADEHFARVLTATAPDLLRYFERRVGSSDAADLLSETMVVAWRRMDVVPEDDEAARMWLFGVARKVLLNAERGNVRRWKLADRLRHVSDSTSASPAADVGLEVRDAVARLDPESAELLRLIHWEGLSIVQTAALMEIPASTARSRYQKAKEDLRLALGIAVVN